MQVTICFSHQLMNAHFRCIITHISVFCFVLLLRFGLRIGHLYFSFAFYLFRSAHIFCRIIIFISGSCTLDCQSKKIVYAFKTESQANIEIFSTQERHTHTNTRENKNSHFEAFILIRFTLIHAQIMIVIILSYLQFDHVWGGASHNQNVLGIRYELCRLVVWFYHIFFFFFSSLAHIIGLQKQNNYEIHSQSFHLTSKYLLILPDWNNPFAVKVQ